MFPNLYTPTTQYNPASSQYAGSGLNLYQQPARQEITRVNGEGGAKAYQLAPNSSVLLLDETNPIVWLKTTDGAGYPNLIPYTITPFEPEPTPDFRSLESRIAKLEERLNESHTTGPSTNQKPNDKSRDGQ